MPVVTVSLPRHPDAGAVLSMVADAVAAALALQEGEVLATQLETTQFVASGRPSTAEEPWWPIVSIHGSERDATATARARGAASSAVRDWAQQQGQALGGVWTEWILP